VPSRVEGYVSTTMAPLYVPNAGINESEFRVYALSNTESSFNFLAEEFSSLTAGLNGTWSSLVDNHGASLYLGAVATDIANGAFWGWDSGGNVYTNEGLSQITLKYSTYWDVAVWNSGSAYGLVPGGGCSLSPPNGGLCLYRDVSGTWTDEHTSGEQIAFDTLAWGYDSNP
jgi:hypothetical protein